MTWTATSMSTSRWASASTFSVTGWPFVEKAIEEQMKARDPRRPPNRIWPRKVAALIGELTGMQRVTFCNSGTEAVMTALRLVRASQAGASKVVTFSGSYHGHSDGHAGSGAPPGKRLACGCRWRRGFPNTSSMTCWFLPYRWTIVLSKSSPPTAGELAAVFGWRPVQSRNPGLQPAAFSQTTPGVERAKSGRRSDIR